MVMNGMGLWDGSDGMGDLWGCRVGGTYQSSGWEGPLGAGDTGTAFGAVGLGLEGRDGRASVVLGGKQPTPASHRPFWPLTFTPSAFLFSKLLAAVGVDSVSAPPRTRDTACPPKPRPFPATQPDPTLGADSACHPSAGEGEHTRQVVSPF